MTNRLTATQLLVPVLLVAGVAGYFLSDRGAATATAPQADVVSPATEAPSASPAAALPPGHPAVPGAGPHGKAAGAMPGVPVTDNAGPPAITWTAPASWKSVANPSPMRLATLKVNDTTEVSVARAGGTLDANVQRWTGQFEAGAKVERTDKTVRGLKVTVVRIGGTFLGGGMGAKERERQDSWA
ncbi:MAG: hypothetical protein ACHREM_09875, partial [Polyangiales bacterium]